MRHRLLRPTVVDLIQRATSPMYVSQSGLVRWETWAKARSDHRIMRQTEVISLVLNEEMPDRFNRLGGRDLADTLNGRTMVALRAAVDDLPEDFRPVRRLSRHELLMLALVLSHRVIRSVQSQSPQTASLAG